MSQTQLIREAHPGMTAPDGSRQAPVVAAVVVILAVLLTVGPLLSRIEFCRTLENLNIATALEAARDGHWLIPSLNGEPRTKKPPLTAWLTAASIRPATLADLSSGDPVVRERARRRLAREARLPALLAACGMLAAAYALGSCVGGPRLGASSTAVLAGTFAFLQHAQVASTDVQLALWVAVANATFAGAALRGRRWAGCLGGGFAVGMACMSKGPVALVQTVLPLACFLGWRALAARRAGAAPATRPTVRWAGPIACGFLVALAAVLPWPLAALWADPAGQWRTWLIEVTGADSPARSEPWFQYVLLLPVALFPWSIFAIAGLWAGITDAVRASRRRPAGASADAETPGSARPPHAAGPVLVMFLVVAPLLVMGAVKDKKQRYLLPVVPAASVLAAWSLTTASAGTADARRRRLLRAGHWAGVAVVALGLPIAGGLGPSRSLRGVDGAPWFGGPTAAAAAAGAAVILLAGILSRRRAALPAATLLAMLLTAATFVTGYATSEPARAPLKPLADAVWAGYPDAIVYDAIPGGERSSVDLSIYLNRATGPLDPALFPSRPAGDRPCVAVMLQRRGDPQPSPPPGWNPLLDLRRGAEHWWAYVLPARSAADARAR